jgi:hypothetical protein
MAHRFPVLSPVEITHASTIGGLDPSTGSGGSKLDHRKQIDHQKARDHRKRLDQRKRLDHRKARRRG